MSRYLSGLYPGTSPFAAFRDMAEGFERALPGPLRDAARRARQLSTGMPGSGTLFEELGFSYVGPINGHDMEQLLPVLRAARARATGPILIHAGTVKGKGYAPAETSADKYHGVARFDVASGAQAKGRSNAPAYTEVVGQSLTAAAERDPRIVAVTAAMPSGTGLYIMARRFPPRVFDVAYLSNLPGFVVMAAGDEAELVHMVATAAAWDEGPIAFRYPRGEGMGVDMPERGAVLEIGRGRILREGTGVALLSFGAQVLHWLARSGRLDEGLRIRTMTLPDRFIERASPAAMYRGAGLTAADIAATALQALGVAMPGFARARA